VRTARDVGCAGRSSSRTATASFRKNARFASGISRLASTSTRLKKVQCPNRSRADLRSCARRFRDCQLILGVDRLDYSKGIPERLRAYRDALERHPELRGRVVLIQVVVPSRWRFRDITSSSNASIAWSATSTAASQPAIGCPVQYHFSRTRSRRILLAHYRGCDIAFVTPPKGRNESGSQEYCACRIDEDGALISQSIRRSGGSNSKPAALLVNPYDVEEVADTVLKAFRMTDAERAARDEAHETGGTRGERFFGGSIRS